MPSLKAMIHCVSVQELRTEELNNYDSTHSDKFEVDSYLNTPL